VANRDSIPKCGFQNVRTIYDSGASEVKTTVIGIGRTDAEIL